jgi:hypothetical protein
VAENGYSYTQGKIKKRIENTNKKEPESSNDKENCKYEKKHVPVNKR